MRRRGFLGFLGGAAVAGPGIVKQAAAETLADLSLGGVGSGGAILGRTSGYINFPLGAQSDTPVDYVGGMKQQLAKLLGRSAAERAFHVSRTHVAALDPDLASYRSMSLGYRIALQREREYERQINDQRGWIEGHILGWFA